MSGPSRTVATSRNRIGVPFSLTATAIFSMSLDILDVAAPADHVFNPGELHDTAAHVVIAHADRFHDGGNERR